MRLYFILAFIFVLVLLHVSNPIAIPQNVEAQNATQLAAARARCEEMIQLAEDKIKSFLSTPNANPDVIVPLWQNHIAIAGVKVR